uniref:Uncharacterized protein n=1 Tax=Nannospalax galili TaxID=1026970 RepID=A0A8C6QUW3_NANGA
KLIPVIIYNEECEN